MGYIKHIVEAPEDGVQGLQRPMREDAEHLLLQRILGHSIKMVQPCLGRPADIQRGSDMRPCPIENFRNLIPIRHLFEVHLLHRCPGDNHAVILLIAHQLKVGVEGFHVFDGRILRRMALDFHERDFHLKRRIGEQTHQVSLRRNLQRHQVEYDEPQRADILSRGTRRIHHEYVFLLQQLYRRQSVW